MIDEFAAPDWNERSEHADVSPVREHRISAAPARPIRHEQSQRQFLIVSAPFGPFSHDLAMALRHEGASVSRVLLNAGDVLDWGLGQGVAYFGPWSNFDDWLKRTIKARQITDVVTYGDSSPHAGLALRVATQQGLRRHVLEQGYFRPDWVTLETNGVNANSSLPRDPGWFRDHPAAELPPDAETVGRTTPAAVAQIFAYHLMMYLGVPVFPRYRAHYHDSAFKQAAGHFVRYGAQAFARAGDRRRYDKATSGNTPVFLCALQRPGDSQLWRHSVYASLPAFLSRVIASFAANAPENARLVVRRHPLDPGLVSYGSVILAAARRNRVEDRIFLTDFGKLHEVLPRMAGVVCINSTAGLAAIEFGKPTIALGRAIYGMPGLTHQGDLDGFWGDPQAPDGALYEAFRRVVMATTQVNGAYATPKGRRLAVPEIAKRMLAPESSSAAG